MISWLLIVIGSFVLGFFILGPLMFPRKPLEACRCRAPYLLMEVYEDDLGECPLHTWSPEEGPRLVMGKKHTYKAKCCQCGRIRLEIGTFPPPEEKSFS